MEILRRHKHECELRKLAVPPSDGLYCNVTWDNVMCWDYTPAGTEAHQTCASYVHGFTTAGEATRECLSDGTWKPNLDRNKTEGWTNFTACVNSNGTQVSNPDLDHFEKIQFMSNIGYGISLLSLIVAVGIMIAFRRLHCKSNVLHINLFLAFILRASLSFLKRILFVDGLGLEKDIIRLPRGAIDFNPDGLHWECKLIISLFTYSVAASMMWIFMEGFYLVMLVHRTLLTERHGTRIYVLTGWLSPLVFIIPWIIVRIYFENEFCWNKHRVDGYFWIIKAPINLSILINFAFFINIVYFLFARVRVNRHVKNDAQQLRKTGKFVLVLIPLFGVFYIISIAFPHGISMKADIIYLYCEMFYNSFQGFLLALLFCFLNEEVHKEIKHCWHRRIFNKHTSRSILMSSWRKTSRTSGDNFTRDSRLVSDVNTDVGDHSKSKYHAHVSWKRSVRSSDVDLGKVTSSWHVDEADALMNDSKSDPVLMT
ncbi:hypothetical protein ACF0H5_018667 [Mactra antiquata]